MGGLADLLKAVANNWSILEVLLEAETVTETKDQCYVTGLAHKLDKESSEISVRLKDLEQRGLVCHEESKADQRKYYELSTKGIRIVEGIIQGAEEKPKENILKLVETDPEQLDFLLRMLNNQSKIETLTAIMEDFGDLCEKTYIWKFRKTVWPVIKEHVSNGETQWAKFLSVIIRNMGEIGEEKELQEAKKEFLKEIETAYINSISQEPSDFQETALEIIKLLASENEKLVIYKNILENAIRKKDVNTTKAILRMDLLDGLLDSELGKDKKKDLRAWFYKLMDTEEQSASKKALEIYLEYARKRL